MNGCQSGPTLQSTVVCYEGMPLAVYYELAAHLQSLPNVQAETLWNSTPVFSYHDSQLEGIRIHYSTTMSFAPIEAILNHYGSWQSR